MTRRVHLTAVELTGFRNYGRLSLPLDDRHVVLTGPNGAGKTNLIEAVSLLSPGRGLRRATLGDMRRAGADGGFSVFARLQAGDDAHAVGTGTETGDGGTANRRIRINGTWAKSTDALLDLCRVLWLTPAMDGLFTGPAADRRRFVDRMVLAIDPGHGRRSADYDKAMRQRNRVLEEAPGARTDTWLDGLEAQLARLGTAIIAARQELIDLLTALIGEAGAAGPFPTAAIAIGGDLEATANASPASSDIEARFADLLREMRPRERAAGRTLTGPHRADLTVHHRDKAMPAGQCSTGEQKALLTGLVLAHAALTARVSGLTPILLLDEIAAHLDPDRRAALFARIDALGGQAFMTGTDRSLFDAMGTRAQYFTVREGMVTPDA